MKEALRGTRKSCVRIDFFFVRFILIEGFALSCSAPPIKVEVIQKYGPIAQWIEHSPSKRMVAGSSPARSEFLWLAVDCFYKAAALGFPLG